MKQPLKESSIDNCEKQEGWTSEDKSNFDFAKNSKGYGQSFGDEQYG